MIPLSLAITVPDGTASCLPLRQLAAMGDSEKIEVIVADGTDAPVPSGSPAMVHLRMPGADTLTLRRAAIARASHEWVVVIEDHCVLDPGFFAAYREAILAQPGIDLFSGAVTNETGPNPSSMANFLFGYCDHWPKSRARPSGALIANLAVRKSAIGDEALACDGGFEFETLARLGQASRYAHCARAVADHVQNGSLLECCRARFRNGRSTAASWRSYARESGWALARHCFQHASTLAVRRPLYVLRSIRGAYPSRWVLAPHFFLLGASQAVGAMVEVLSGSGSKDRARG